MAVQNDTSFLSIVNVVDYSILVGFDEDSHEIVVGIIDYLRQVGGRSLFNIVCHYHRHHIYISSALLCFLFLSSRCFTISFTSHFSFSCLTHHTQYDFVKRMERMGKSVGMLAGQAEPTIIQPSQYRKRFTNAMERYFMTVPDKWISHES